MGYIAVNIYVTAPLLWLILELKNRTANKSDTLREALLINNRDPYKSGYEGIALCMHFIITAYGEEDTCRVMSTQLESTN